MRQKSKLKKKKLKTFKDKWDVKAKFLLIWEKFVGRKLSETSSGFVQIFA